MKVLNLTFDLSAITSDAVVMCVIGYLVVFTVLLIMVLTYLYMPIIHDKIVNRSVKTATPYSGKSGRIPADVNAAISMALFLYMDEMHDNESNLMTIKHSQKTYSPWNSKYYAMNTYFSKR